MFLGFELEEVSRFACEVEIKGELSLGLLVLPAVYNISYLVEVCVPKLKFVLF